MTIIYQVELTNFCNLKCSYCPHSTMQRPKGHMSEQTLANVLKYCNGSVVLHHFGEVFLHPKWEDRLNQVAEAGIKVFVSSNAVLLERNIDKLLNIKGEVEVAVSAHNWIDENRKLSTEEYFKNLRNLQSKTTDTNVTISKVYNVDENGGLFLHNWTSGENFEWDYLNECFFLKDNYTVVLWNGDLATCCADHEGKSVNLNINTHSIHDRIATPWEGCKTCEIFLGSKNKTRVYEIDGRKVLDNLSISEAKPIKVFSSKSGPNLVAMLEIDPPVKTVTSENKVAIKEQLVSADYEARNVTKLEIENPKVSVIFVARNESEWLQKSLDSIYSVKNNTSFEVIVYDDLSEDNCATDIAVHQLLVSSKEPIGPARARNMGALASRGEILIFCDAHLKFKDNWIDDLIQPILDGRCDAVNPIISDIAVPTTTGHGWDFDLQTYTYKWAQPCSEFKLVPGLAGGCFAINRTVFFNVGMFDRKFYRWGMEDSELGLRLMLSGYRIGIEPKVDVGHFFKEINDYGVDWFSYNYNFLRMAYVNMNDEDVDYVYSLIPGEDDKKKELLLMVKETSKYRKKTMQALRKLDFKDYKAIYGRIIP